ncbi:MAG: leucyl aminopeptidase [Candidatus Cloacimonadota bacterium]|nr:MAG: leucyl aminopeptidase [Candidatus Cloacimonadota bacterium]PIE77678.1 MAG: leucyl aminopeptidase [Candidatus Delongbacteria bacterium]
METKFNQVDIKVNTSLTETLNVDTDYLILFLDKESKTLPKDISEIDAKLNNYISTAIENGSFSGNLSEILKVTTLGNIKPKHVVVIGIGELKCVTLETFRKVGATAFNSIKADKKDEKISFFLTEGLGLDMQSLATSIMEGVDLSSYNFSLKFSEKKESKEKSIELLLKSSENKNCVDKAIIEAEKNISGVFLARDLVNYPPNYATPTLLAKAAEDIAKETNLDVKIMGQKEIEDHKMGSFLSVARGSNEEPKFIIMEHNKEKKDEYKTLVLVGKGITFDTGGYNLKPTVGIFGMKHDMAGGAAVIGAMKSIAKLDLPVHVVGIVPACENKINNDAYLPEDVITASDGTTIEVTNTDAEGRLILADALIYAQKYKPNCVIDIATLTGACAMALAGVASGLFTESDSLRDRLLSAAETSDERLWSLPMYEEMGNVLKSEIADIKNSNKGGGVGSASMFLKKFAKFDSWAHIDMAGLSEDPHNRPYNKKGFATGYGVRLFVDLVRSIGKK